jgi:histidinol dehydrogenase
MGAVVNRFTAAEWQASPLSRARSDLGATPEQAASVREICARVAREGDAALFDYGRRFDGWSPGPGAPLEVPRADVEAAPERLERAERRALELAAERIRAFHSLQVPEPVIAAGSLQLRTRPVDRAGLYTPGGRAAYPSTVLMTAVPARVAGVSEVVLASPPAADGSLPPAILAAAQIAGVDAVYRMGGAQAVAALAYGTESVPRVDVIAGPGNLYVTLAKREVFGAVGVDGIAGPTEILIVADGTAPAHLVAADLASQLEHDPEAWAVLVTDSAALADAVEESFTDLVRDLDRAEVVRAAHCCIVRTDSIDESVAVAEDFAPEHLELLGDAAERQAGSVRNAGAVFVGPYTPVSLGDYVIGPNHTLPTARGARFASPLGVHTFLKRTSVAEVGREEFAALAEPARALAYLEGFQAHARALEVRAEDGR